MEWIVKNRDDTDSLTHYGVKGMRWGVRKEQETSGRNKASAKDLVTKAKTRIAVEKGRKNAKENGIYTNPNISLQATGESSQSMRERYDKVDERLGDAFSTVVNLNTMINQSDRFPHYKQFVKDVKNGSSTRDPNLNDVLKKYSTSSGQNFDIEAAHNRLSYLSSKGKTFGKLSDEEWAELEKLTEEATALMGYYNGVYGRLPSEEEIEEQKKVDAARKDVRDAISNAGLDLQEGQSMGAIISDGTILYTYTNHKGETRYSGSLDGLLKTAKKDANYLKDFCNRPSSTSREKNVDPDAKPVSVKKGKKIEVSDIERLAKSLSQGTSAGKAKATREYLSKNPEIEKKVQEILDKEWEKTELDKISKYKKSRGKKNRK